MSSQINSTKSFERRLLDPFNIGATRGMTGEIKHSQCNEIGVFQIPVILNMVKEKQF